MCDCDVDTWRLGLTLSDFFKVVGHQNISCSRQEKLFSIGLKQNNHVWWVWFHVIPHIPLSRLISTSRPTFASSVLLFVCLVLNLVAWCYFCVQSLIIFFCPSRPPAGGSQWRRAGDDGVGPDSQRPSGGAGLCPAGELHQWGGLHRESAQTLQREPDLCE